MYRTNRCSEMRAKKLFLPLEYRILEASFYIFSEKCQNIKIWHSFVETFFYQNFQLKRFFWENDVTLFIQLIFSPKRILEYSNCIATFFRLNIAAIFWTADTWKLKQGLTELAWQPEFVKQAWQSRVVTRVWQPRFVRQTWQSKDKQFLSLRTPKTYFKISKCQSTNVPQISIFKALIDCSLTTFKFLKRKFNTNK